MCSPYVGQILSAEIEAIRRFIDGQKVGFRVLIECELKLMLRRRLWVGLREGIVDIPQALHF